ncbi:MAG: hypothetical protein IJN74_04290 [Clostridia bacterium]|nr:hypothetical protein [Clostridia bacterium]
MKKLFCILLAVSTLFLAACSPKEAEGPEKTEETKETTVSKLPFEGALSLWMENEDGTWRTDLELKPDGTFTGAFHDTNGGGAGIAGEDTPYAGMEYENTLLMSSFSGKFTDFVKKDETTFRITLSKLTLNEPLGTQWFDDGQYFVRYVSTAPYSLTEGQTYTFYTPDVPVGNLDEEFRLWQRPRSDAPTLGEYGLCNNTTKEGFFGFQ